MDTDAETTRSRLADEDLPALFRAADRSSQSHQKLYLRLVRIDLVTMITGALLGSIIAEDPDVAKTLALTSASLLFIGLILTVVLGLRRFDQLWYRSRAVAESVKTLAWRYVTASQPFEPEGSDASGQDARSRFLDRVDQIHSSDARGLTLVPDTEKPQQITPAMAALRDAPVEERIAAYLEGRIRDQQVWYAAKANLNRKAERRFFFALIGAQGFAVISSFALIDLPLWNPAGTFAAIAAAVAAWLQVKQHQELAEAYGSTAQALGTLAERAETLTTDDELSQFVADAENAISREHTSWLARRDH